MNGKRSSGVDHERPRADDVEVAEAPQRREAAEPERLRVAAPAAGAQPAHGPRVAVGQVPVAAVVRGHRLVREALPVTWNAGENVRL